MDLSVRRVCVTGGSGFLGSHIVEALYGRGCKRVFVPRSQDYDLREKVDVQRMFDDAQPNVVIHSAGVVGGIGANMANPGKFFYDNLMMGSLLIEEARVRTLEKLVIIGTICSYPKLTQVPFREDHLWDGYPEETNAPYGIAKKALLVQAQAYREQYGLNTIYLLPVNLYGPRDNFDPTSSHVIPALIKRCIDAKETGAPSMTVWGSGQQTREFLYAADCAEGILKATERYAKHEPVNLGTGVEISIAETVEIIANLVGYEGEILWDRSKPDGQPRRCLDVSRASREFGFMAATPFEDGLRATIEWYRASSTRENGTLSAG